MVREENVKLMSRIAMYEKHEGKTEIPMHCFYKADYIRLNTLKTLVHATVAFAMVVSIAVIYHLDVILNQITKVDYKTFCIPFVLAYAVWEFLYWIVARAVYSHRYEAARSRIIIYNHNLKKLQEEANKEIVKTKGGGVVDDIFIDF